MRVLIVDDSRAMQQIVKRCLEKCSYDVLETKLASSGEEALDIARFWEPDLILTDWHMPGMSGLDLLHRLNREMLNLNVGLVTTETGGQRIKEALDAGARFVVNKPFEMDVLQEAVMVIVDEYKAQKEQKKVAAQEKIKSDVLLPSEDALRVTINEMTQEVVLLEAIESITEAQCFLPGVVALLANKATGKVPAVLILDVAAACILGGAVLKAPVKHVQETIQSNLVAETPLLKACEKVLAQIGLNCRSNSVPDGLSLIRANVVHKNFDRLRVMLNTEAARRIDVEIAVVGFGQGKMTLITS